MVRQLRSSGQDAAEIGERPAHLDAVAGDLELAQVVLKITHSLLQHANGLPQLACRFEVAQEEDIVSQVADPDLRHAELAARDGFRFVDDESGDPHALEVSSQGGKMSDKLLPPNAQSVPGNAVKHDDPRVSLLDFAT